MVRAVSFTLNGKKVRPRVDDQRMLLWVLRYDLGLSGTKFGCGEGICGACTVLVDDRPVRSCSALVGEVAGKRVLTIEGLARDGRLQPVQQAFLEHNAFQCGYCTPGMILTAHALLLQKPRPTRGEIVDALDDNLCRCGSHKRIIEAVEAAGKAAGSAPSRRAP